MLRAVGAVILFLSCAGFGYSQGNLYQERIRQLHTLMKIAEQLKGEIAYGKIPLPEALRKIGNRTEVIFSLWLSDFAEKLEQFTGMDYEAILKDTMEEIKRKTCLEDEDWDDFYEAMRYAGSLHYDTQIQFLQRYLQETEKKTEILQAQLPQKQKMLSSFGVLGGIFLVIILL